MTPADIVKSLISRSGKQQKEIAKELGWSTQSLTNRLHRNTLSAVDFMQIADLLGFEVKVVERESQDEIPTRVKGIGRHVRRMVNGVVYDTNKADAICHSDPRGEAFYEVYRDYDGRYFIVFYAYWDGGVDAISPIESEEYVNTLIAECCTQ